MGILIFEDRQVADLHPITLGRPAALITCGGQRLLDLAARIDSSPELLVRPHLRDVVRADHPACQIRGDERAPAASDGLRVCLNARLVPSATAQRTVAEMLRTAQPCAIYVGDSLAAACVTSDLLDLSEVTSGEQLHQRLAESGLPPRASDLQLLAWPHDVVHHHQCTFVDNLQSQLARCDLAEVRDGVFAAATAKLSDFVVTDTSLGPILLHDGVFIGPHTLLRGPLSIGANARINEHAAIKEYTWLGSQTKLGGEVEASIVEAYSNKQHHGFLGHSYLGSWVNLGAGTCNSDLKNTYGIVNAEYHGNRISTGMQFLGTIIGDYVKTAINSSIYTGKTIGAASMVYGTVVTNVPSFANYARQFGSVTTLPTDVVLKMQERMFARRDLSQRPCDVQLIHDMFALTQAERERAAVTAGPPEF